MNNKQEELNPYFQILYSEVDFEEEKKFVERRLMISLGVIINTKEKHE